MSEYLTVGDVAFLEGVSYTTVTKWIREGHLKAERQLHIDAAGQPRYMIMISEEALAEFELYGTVRNSRPMQRQDRDERKLNIRKLDELEEVLYDTTCLVQELRERIEKDWV